MQKVLACIAAIIMSGFIPEIISAQSTAPFEVVINEIMVRPSPPAGLPEAEYIELFNHSELPVNLNNWTIWAGSRSRTIPWHIIQPGSFLLIAHENYAGMLDEFGDVIYFPGFPVLPNSGQLLVLRDESQNVISAIDYSDQWYKNRLKETGGWSLEQIDPYNPCGGKDNWKASTSSTGGTPGMKNSVADSNIDHEQPGLVRASISASGEIVLHFNEPMHPWSEWNIENFSAPALGNPTTVVPAQPFFDKVNLKFPGNIEPEKEYTVKITGNMFDCAGNFINDIASSVRIIMPAYPEKNDIVINELLFNPFPGGVNFIELYNRSGRTIDLKQVIVAGITNQEPNPAYIIAPEGYLLFPGEYVVLSTDPETLRSHYWVPSRSYIINMEKLPPLNNESGRIVIANLEMDPIDDLIYTSSMHSPFLTNVKGVSLERINFHRPSSDLTNWISASGNSGFATPGYRNSQFSDVPETKYTALAVDPQIFSPDNSGYNDAVNISYKLDKPGFSGSITIYDSRGRPVKKLVRNEIFGTTGVYSWDGRNEANGQSGLGIYLILMEIIHPDGDIIKHKETVVLGGRLGR